MPDDPESLHYAGQWSFANGEYQSCIDREAKALKEPGVNDLALLQMNMVSGFCNDRLGRPDQALLDFQAADAINRKLPHYDPVTAYQFLRFLLLQDRQEDARSLVAEILARTPDFGPAHLELSKSLASQRQPEKAIIEAKRALAGTGNDANATRAAHVLLAREYTVAGERERADAERRWVESHPNTGP